MANTTYYSPGRPQLPYRAEKAAIEALEGLDEGAYAYATDTNEIGFYDGAVWRWLKPGGYREKLTANRTYYVRTDGNDSNDGLINSSGGAFLTIQKAVDVIAETLDIAGYTVTVQVGDGTYTGSVTLKNVVGFATPGNLVIQGNSVTPSNVVISTTSANCFNASNISTVWDVKDMKLQTTTAGICLSISAATLRFGNLDFGATPTTGANSHISVGGNGNATAIGNYTISGSTARHWRVIPGVLTVQNRTITLTGTPNFATQFALASRLSLIQCDGNTYSGSGTGTRYLAELNSVIFSNGGTLPGNAAGSTATGGQYA